MACSAVPFASARLLWAFKILQIAHLAPVAVPSPVVRRRSQITITMDAQQQPNINWASFRRAHSAGALLNSV
jgi:hypothetical protein